ncbi:MAG: HAMP domain-containing protein [Deltaproteobacteria bacterium]|jgi:signal transduction histidine kinase|nr:HAMP domain-containing protein [Deltaproteobacteria bacterium]
MERSKTQGISIFVRILIVFLCVNIITSGILIVIAFVFNRISVEKHAKENITQQIESIRNNFENEYRVNLVRSLQTLGSFSTLSDYVGASEVEKLVIGKKVEMAFIQTIKTHKNYHSIKFVDAIGNINISVVGKLRNKEYVNLKRKEFKQESSIPSTLKASVRLFKLLESIPLLLSAGYMEWFMPPREIQLEGPFLEENGSYVLLAGISKLDLDIGDFGGVIMIRQRLDEFFQGLREIQFFDENPVWVFDAKGHVLQFPENEKISFDPSRYLPDTFQRVSQLIDVEEGIVAYQDFSIIPGKPFIRLVISIPHSLLFKDFAGAVQFFSLVLVGSIVLVLLVALYVSRYLSRPIIKLAAAANRLALGDLSTKVQIETTGEVQVLVNSFNQMTDDLLRTIKSRDASLDSLVKEVAERQQMEKQLLQSQKMESLGTLASGIAHDFNTLIGTIIGYSDIIANEIPEHTEILEYLQTIIMVANRAKALVKQIGDFSRQKTTDKILMNTVSFIHHSMEFIKTILPTTIRIQEEYQADELIINANEDQINQLIVNLCSNAGDFIKDNVGMLTIKVEKINKKNQLDSFPGIQLANHMKLSISDTGSGINPEKIDRIFDPFYTTKEIGKGSGLGLSIVHNIVKNHNGHIFVESTLGEGTTFSIFIPLAEGSQG